MKNSLQAILRGHENGDLAICGHELEKAYEL